MLFQPPLHKSERECSPVDRDVELGEEERDGADVILMAVGEQECATCSRLSSR